MIEQTWDIPGPYDMGAQLDAQKETRVEIIVKIRGGALPNNHAVLYHFMEVDLNKMGQLGMKIETPEPESLTDDLVTRSGEVPHYLTINLDKARIVTRDGQMFQQSVVTY